MDDLKTRAVEVQPWPYSAMVVSLPDPLSVLELLMLLSIADAGSDLIRQSLLEHYQQNGLPQYPGTLRARYLTDRVARVIMSEASKQPSENMLSTTSRHFPILLRTQEKLPRLQHPVYPVSELKEGMPRYKAVNIVENYGVVRFDGVQQQCEPYEIRTLEAGELSDKAECSVCYHTLTEENAVRLCCGHVFTRDCYDNALKTTQNCPECRRPLFPHRTGNQPHGTMYWGLDNVAKEKQHYFQIIFRIPAGQLDNVHYPAENRICYIPDTDKGRRALKMMITGFERGLLFTVGYSLSRAQDNVVIKKDIPLKSSLDGGPDAHGYPDENYLPELIGVLKELGIEEP